MAYRQDSRSFDEFKSDIKRHSIIQGWLVELLKEELTFRGLSMSIQDNGCDNSGEFLEKSNNKADYKIRLENETDYSNVLIEVKCCPHLRFLTWKVDSLKAVIRDNAWICLVANVNTKSANKEDSDLSKLQWTLFSPAVARRLLDSREPKCYNRINGGKPSVQLLPAEYSEFFEFNQFLHLKVV